MSYHNGPKIVNDGLALYWDIGNPNSYSGTGSTIYDLCGNYNGTLYNSPTFSTDNKGILTFNGSSSYALSTSANFSTTNCTVMGAAKYNGSNGRMINAASNNWLMGHWNNSVSNFYAEGWITSVGAGGTDNNWKIYTTLNDYSSDSWSFYINGQSNVLNSNSGSYGPNGIAIGRYNPGASEYSNGSFSFVIVYNRILSASEILQNYNALRGRFGL